MISLAGASGAAAAPTAPPTAPLHVVIATVGSRGDVQPYVALGLALQRRGFRVTLAVEDRMAPLVAQFGIARSRLEGDFCGVMFEPGTHEVLARDRLGEIMQLLGAWGKRWRREDVLRSYETALAGADIVVGAGMTMTATFCVAESMGVPWAPLLLAAESQVVDRAAGVAVVDSTAFLLSSVGFESAVLDGALARFSQTALLFPYAADPVPTPGPDDPPVVTGATVNVTTADERLGLRTDESYAIVTRAASGGATIAITAASCFGALRALETLAQLIFFNASSRQYGVSATNVSDAPRFPYRGVMIDTARAYLHPNSIKVVVDLLAYSKMNVLHLHLTDDQSWPVVLESYPLLAQRGALQNGSAHTYSAADLRDIVAYARDRGVRVIPEFDTPAHFSPLFNSYPEFAAIFFPPWQPDNTSALCLVDPSNPGLMNFIGDIWAELASIFPDEALFIGGDEFWDCYQYAPAVRAWERALSPPLNNSGDVYRWYIRQLVDGVVHERLGRKAYGWADIDDAFAPEKYPDDSVVNFVWTGFYGGNWQDDVGALAQRNASIVVSGPFYVSATDRSHDYPHNTWQQMYATDLANFTGATPELLDRVLGGELTAWGDAAQCDSGNVFTVLTPNIFALAESWWSPRSVTSGQDGGNAQPRMELHRKYRHAPARA